MREEILKQMLSYDSVVEAILFADLKLLPNVYVGEIPQITFLTINSIETYQSDMIGYTERFKMAIEVNNHNEMLYLAIKDYIIIKTCSKVPEELRESFYSMVVEENVHCRPIGIFNRMCALVVTFLKKQDEETQLPLEFLKWYSGMTTEKILSAYKRWQNERKVENPTPPTQIIQEGKDPKIQ